MHQLARASLTVGNQIIAVRSRCWWLQVYVLSKAVREGRGGRSMCSSLGGNLLAVLTAIFVSEFYVRQVVFPVVLVFVDGYP